MTVNGGKSTTSLHPLRPLTADEVLKARNIVVEEQGGEGIVFAFRSVSIEEPGKADLVEILVAEHGGTATTANPPRLVNLIYDVINQGVFTLTETVVDVGAGRVHSTTTFPEHCQTSYTAEEFKLFQDACVSSETFKDALNEFTLPDNFEITIDPWPYGNSPTRSSFESSLSIFVSFFFPC